MVIKHFISHWLNSHFSAFTMDVIARCAFGMNIENLGESDDPFMRNAAKIFRPPVNKTPLILLLCKYWIKVYSNILSLLTFSNSYFPKIGSNCWWKVVLHRRVSVLC